MFYPYGFGLGSHWLLYIGVPLILGIWAQIRVTSAFRKWGEVRASSNITASSDFIATMGYAERVGATPVDTKDGSTYGINHFIGRRPVLAFGNSDGDHQMLQYTAAGPGLRFIGIAPKSERRGKDKMSAGRLRICGA